MAGCGRAPSVRRDTITPHEELAMHAVMVTFSLSGMGHADFEAACPEIAPAFAEVPGLIAKLWLGDEAEAVYGGLYLFESREAAEAYRDSEMLRRAVHENPRFGGVSVRAAAVLDAPTRITAGRLALPVGA